MVFFILKTIISKNGNKENPESDAHYLISLLQGINLLSVFSILKSTSKSIDRIDVTFLFVATVFFIPPLFLNYLFFMRNNRYVTLFKGIGNINSPRYYFTITLSYLVFTILFFGFSIWINTI